MLEQASGENKQTLKQIMDEIIDHKPVVFMDEDEYLDWHKKRHEDK